ncbi:MAG: TlpA family protein disulfide reductase [Burkholderiaceae bacterium]
MAAAGGVAWRRWLMRPSDDDPQALWAMRFAKPDGGELVMANLRGKPLILNFWATWCVPCIRELPAFQRFRRDQAAAGWQLLALAVDAPVPVIEFMARFKLDLPVAMAGVEGLELMRQLGNVQGGLPFTVVMRGDGRVLDRKLGETKDEDLANWAKIVANG